MVRAVTRSDLFAGMWKFRPSVSREEVIEVAMLWKQFDTAGDYAELYVRGFARDQFAICFRIRNNAGPEGMRAYIQAKSHDLRCQFGNGLLGWDISEPITTIQ